MNKKISVFYLFLLSAFSVQALASADPRQYEPLTVPLMQYDYVSLSEQHIQQGSAGLFVQREWGSFIGLYSWNHFDDPMLYDFPDTYYSIDTLLDTQFGRHQYLLIFKSDSDNAFPGDWNPIQSGLVYGYELVNSNNWHLVLGGGIAVGEFGLEREDGSTQKVIPVPSVRANYKSDLLQSKFEFLTGPNWSFTVAPNSKFRFTGDFRMDQLRDVRDVIFESNLVYRFFDKDHEMGDFAGVSLGFKNDNLGAFKLEDKHYSETLETHYYAAFASLDLTILKLTAGRAFGGRMLYRETMKENVGAGWFVSVQGLIPL